MCVLHSLAVANATPPRPPTHPVAATCLSVSVHTTSLAHMMWSAFLSPPLHSSRTGLRSELSALQEELGLPHDALQKILTTKGVAIAAEFKRASPSKGDIAVDLAAAGEWIQGLGISDAVRGWAAVTVLALCRACASAWL